jgi:hypothetical protein
MRMDYFHSVKAGLNHIIRWHFIFPAVVLMFFVLGCARKGDSGSTAYEGVEFKSKILNKPLSDYSEEELEEGRFLSTVHCQNCHIYPPPEVLPRWYWNEYLLVDMGRNFGIREHGFYFIDDRNATARRRLDSAGVYPRVQTLEDDKWDKIKAFYLRHAPDTLTYEDPRSLTAGLPIFDITTLPWKSIALGTSMLEITDDRQLLIGYNTLDFKSLVFLLDWKGNVRRLLDVPAFPVDLLTIRDNYVVAFLGSQQAMDDPNGHIGFFSKISKEEVKDSIHLFLSNLERPVQMTWRDMNQDGKNDLLVTEYGKSLGGIHLYVNTGIEWEFKKIVVYNGPGAINTIIRDVNGDGLPDIYALVAQGDENIFLFVNRGGGIFHKQRILRFPSYYGSTFFDLVDFDGDGDEDILYCGGDSGDFGTPFKPFHGIRLFENNGQGSFAEAWFYPQQGVFEAHAKDFDQDGDIDIASIAYYAYNAGMPQEGFIYLENQGIEDNSQQFKGYTFDAAAKYPWIVMDSGDIDDDGDIDIVIGANVSFLSQQDIRTAHDAWMRSGGAILVLENQMVTRNAIKGNQ